MAPFFLNIWMEIADRELGVKASHEMFAFTPANDDTAQADDQKKTSK